MGRVNTRVMFSNLTPGTKVMLLAGLLAGSILVSTALAQSAASKKSSAGTVHPISASTPSRARHTSYLPTDLPPSAKNLYQLTWGVDMLSAKAVDSGLMIRFNYRVVNAEKAKPLNDKKAAPYLIDEKARVKLVVPNLEKVGNLRQGGTPEEGKVYWMVFSNKGNFVKPGNRVSVVIGKFRVDGLVVR